MSFKRASVNDIKRAFEKIKDKFLTLSKVAFSGKYIDLTGTPELGSSAYAHIVDNRTTNVKGFVPDATQLAEMQAEIDEINSTLEGIGGGSGTNLPDGSFVYVLKTSSTSFVDASGNTNTKTIYGALDYFKSGISSHDAGCINFLYPAVGYNFPIIFSKLGTQGAVGLIMDYTNTKPPVFFNFYNNRYTICDPQNTN